MATSKIPSGKNHNSYSSEHTGTKTYVYYRNGVVTMLIDGLKDIPSKQWTQLFTLPSGWHDNDKWFYFDMHSQGLDVRFSVSPSTGVVSVYNYGDAITGTSNAIFLATFVV